MTYDLVVIGGGPAGASAAVFAGRAGLRTAVIDNDKGFTRRAVLRNHLGLPDGITGPELVELGRRHAVASGAQWFEDEVISLSADGEEVRLATAGGVQLQARDVLLAQGVSVALAAQAGLATEPATEPRIKTVLTVDAEGRTSAPHVWAAGVIAGTSVHTIITAGDGARVAINVISAQRGQRYVDHDVLEVPTA